MDSIGRIFHGIQCVNLRITNKLWILKGFIIKSYGYLQVILW